METKNKEESVQEIVATANRLFSYDLSDDCGDIEEKNLEQKLEKVMVDYKSLAVGSLTGKNISYKKLKNLLADANAVCKGVKHMAFLIELRCNRKKMMEKKVKELKKLDKIILESEMRQAS